MSNYTVLEDVKVFTCDQHLCNSVQHVIPPQEEEEDGSKDAEKERIENSSSEEQHHCLYGLIISIALSVCLALKHNQD